MSLTLEIKLSFLLGLCHAGRQALSTWAFAVVPFGMSFRATDMSLNMRLLVACVETPGFDRSESMAVWLKDPLG